MPGKILLRLGKKITTFYLLTFEEDLQRRSICLKHHCFSHQRLEAGSDKMEGSDLIIVQPEKKEAKKKKRRSATTKRTSKSATRR